MNMARIVLTVRNTLGYDVKVYYYCYYYYYEYYYYYDNETLCILCIY